MKLSALAALIKDCGHCCQITAANGRRFISTGYAVYNMDGYPKAKNKNELAAMLSIPEKKMEDIYFEEKTMLSTGFLWRMIRTTKNRWTSWALELLSTEKNTLLCGIPQGQSVLFARHSSSRWKVN